jgi:predicted amidohydrolase
VYNSAVVIGRDGKPVPSLAGHRSYHKSFPVLYGRPGTYGEAGVAPSQIGTQAWDLDFGRIAVLICFDINFPELWHEAAALGAEVVVWPTTMALFGSNPYPELVAYTLTHRFSIVGCGRPGATLDISGKSVGAAPNCSGLCEVRAELDLDATAVFGHDGFNSRGRVCH